MGRSLAGQTAQVRSIGRSGIVAGAVVTLLVTAGGVTIGWGPWRTPRSAGPTATTQSSVAPPTSTAVQEGAEGAAPVAVQPPPPATVRPSPPAAAPSGQAPPDQAPPDQAPPAGFGSVAPIDDGTAARMTASWRPGCPVPLSDLRLVKLTHWGFDGQARPGELVVHRDVAARILGVFAALYEARFPIQQVRLVDEFEGDDDRSMAANNTSAFNCRRVAGTSRWSHHAFGRAIDVNPVQNPYVRSAGDVRPPEGRPYIRRDPNVPGLITANGPVVAAFARIGWPWGGHWRSPDYQHFSSTGR